MAQRLVRAKRKIRHAGLPNRALDPTTSDADRRFLTRRLDELPR
jgi:predicted RNA polymerase sigma factor